MQEVSHNGPDQAAALHSTHLQLLLVAIDEEAHAVSILKVALLNSSIFHFLGFILHMSRLRSDSKACVALMPSPYGGLVLQGLRNTTLTCLQA